ncbi:MAG: hypothetical protein K5751_08575 [Treponemataceae bacterium]|nr:hypothetical protein [Treponemataceae bacterium]
MDKKIFEIRKISLFFLPEEVQDYVQIFLRETVTEILKDEKLAEEIFEAFGTEWLSVEHTRENYAKLTADTVCRILKDTFLDAVNKAMPSIRAKIEAEAAKTVLEEFLF